MKYRRFGKTNIDISALGFGAMRLPKYEDLAIRILRRAFELGVNYLDTALVYGDSELVCGSALKGWRDKVYISTKNPLTDHTTEGWWSRLNQSLERMSVDYIDFYQVVHGLTWGAYTEFLRDGGGMKAVRRAQDEGLIKHVCFSSHDSPGGIVKLIDTGEFEGITVQYNLIDKSYEHVIAHAHSNGLGVVIMGPVGGGRLAEPSEKYRNLIPEGSKSSSEAALRFVLSNPNVTCAISGMSTMEQVEENAEVASREAGLNAREKAAIAAAEEEAKKLGELPCTGCGYCMPCPNGVDIPENMHLYHIQRAFGVSDEMKKAYHDLDRAAEACIECGECEPKCPQRIPIIERLEETGEKLG